jgi:two-component system, sensor histidine kinase YesM
VRKLTLVKRFNNIKIGRKLLLSYLLVVFLPVLLVGIILIFNMRQMVVDRAIREASVNVDRTYSRLNEVLKLVMDISYKLQMDQNLEKLLLADYSSAQEVFDTYYQYNEFNNFINLYSLEIRDIKVYTSNKTLLDSGQFIKITPEILNAGWYRKILDANGRICWQYIYDSNKKGYYISLTRIIKTATNNTTIGTLIISINNDYLNSLVKSEPYDTFFCDDLGTIISARYKEMMGKDIRKSVISVVDGMDEGTWQINYLGKPAKAIIKKFSPSIYNGKFKIVSIVPVSIIEKQTYNTAVLGIIIMASSLLLAFVLILIFTNAISKRVKQLSMDMHQVAMGNFEFKPTIEGDDEIGQLSGDLEIMVKSIKRLIQEVNDVNMQKNMLDIKQREIKLKLLANQINPHFLFNSLETIRMKAHVKGEKEIAEVVKLLGKIIRNNLEIGYELVTLESELDIVKSYLEIQKFRYGERINYEISYESEDIRKYRILPMTIQPIVENSIVHSLEFKEDAGKVSINLAKKNFYLVITIEDDGVGMSAERLQEVLDSLNDVDDTPGKRIGLKNVHQRIRLFYGAEYGLKIYSKINIGTRIEIAIPREG